jgi:hypothetical protein
VMGVSDPIPRAARERNAIFVFILQIQPANYPSAD